MLPRDAGEEHHHPPCHRSHHDGISSRLVEALLDQVAGGHSRCPGLLWAHRGRSTIAHSPERDADPMLGRLSKMKRGTGMTADDDSIEEAVLGEAPESAPAEMVANAEPEAVTGEATEAGDAEPDDLLGQLSRAMHAAAGSQRLRIAEELGRQRAAEVTALKARTGSEAKALKKISEHDISEVNAWAKTATELIAAERVRRIDARREQLQAELVRQDVIVEREVLAVEAAVESHQAELDAFFSRLERESDPAEIARLASSAPSLPSLVETAAAARRQATAGFALLDEGAEGAAGGDATADDGAQVSTTRLMAVMAPTASDDSGADVARPWEPAPRAIAVPAGVGAAATANESNASEAPVSAGSVPLLHAIPSTRPMDRLRSWNQKPDDDPDREG
jgi:hypothetical protein